MKIPKTLTAAEALQLLKILADDRDVDVAHSDADEVLCALLRSLGHEDVVDAWKEVPKWYA